MGPRRPSSRVERITVRLIRAYPWRRGLLLTYDLPLDPPEFDFAERLDFDWPTPATSPPILEAEALGIPRSV